MKALFVLFILVFNLVSSYAGTIHFDITNGQVDSGFITAKTTFDEETDQCLVDTGARATTVKLPLLSQYVPSGSVPSGGISGEVIKADIVKVNKISINDWNINDRNVRRVSRLPYNCLIGNDVFIDQAISIDFTNNQISNDQDFRGKTFELNHYKNTWFGFKAEIGDQKIDTLFDTGAALTTIDSDFVLKNPDNFEFVQQLSVNDSSDKTLEASLYIMKNIRYGEWSAQNVYVISMNLANLQEEAPSVKMIFGFNIISKNNWYFNNMAHTWSLLP